PSRWVSFHSTRQPENGLYIVSGRLGFGPEFRAEKWRRVVDARQVSEVGCTNDRPVRSTTRMPSGGRTSAAGPTIVITPSSTRTVWSEAGGAPVPSTTAHPVRASRSWERDMRTTYERRPSPPGSGRTAVNVGAKTVSLTGVTSWPF